MCSVPFINSNFYSYLLPHTSYLWTPGPDPSPNLISFFTGLHQYCLIPLSKKDFLRKSHISEDFSKPLFQSKGHFHSWPFVHAKYQSIQVIIEIRKESFTDALHCTGIIRPLQQETCEQSHGPNSQSHGLKFWWCLCCCFGNITCWHWTNVCINKLRPMYGTSELKMVKTTTKAMKKKEINSDNKHPWNTIAGCFDHFAPFHCPRTPLLSFEQYYWWVKHTQACFPVAQCAEDNTCLSKTNIYI